MERNILYSIIEGGARALTKNQKVTMADVAREAGVSSALVSVVFRNAPGASPKTRKKVKEVAEQLGYIPDQRASRLRARQNRDIGVVFAATQPFHSTLIEELYAALDKSEYPLVLSPKSTRRSEKEAIRSLVSYRVGAIILIGGISSDAEIKKLVGNIPVIYLARKSTDPDIQWVVSDDRTGIVQAISHLVGLGHKNICYVSSRKSASGLERESVFSAAIEDAGLVNTAQVYDGGITPEMGAKAARELLGHQDSPTAIVAFNDRCAKTIMDIAQQKHLSIPQDFSLVGFDDSEIASRSYVQLTTIRQETAQLASHAAQKAIEVITGSTLAGTPNGLYVPTRLVVRKTTGPIAV